MIRVLSKDTIDKIAAGEVIERPVSVVKELVENSVDAGATSVTVEIRNGGIDLIRVTDNGCGIPAEELRTAFLRHATGKITDAADLAYVQSLGFRGEALSSIAAVTRCEAITRTANSVSGIRYVIEGGEELSFGEVGAPAGTTFVCRDLFFSVPARRKFLKTGATEASHVAEMMEKMALSHPEVAFRFLSNNQLRLQTSGKGNLRDVIYAVYGKEITGALLPVEVSEGPVRVRGFVAKPQVSRPNRNFETYFINGRYIKSAILSKAIEDGFENRLMQHQFPFAVLDIRLDPETMDVNVHPTKMEVRFARPTLLYDIVQCAVKESLQQAVLIPRALEEEEIAETEPTGFRQIHPAAASRKPSPDREKAGQTSLRPAEPFEPRRMEQQAFVTAPGIRREESLFLRDRSEERPDYRLVGQVFSTYWILEWNNKMYFMDQHAAHEKVNYERLLRQYRDRSVASQFLDPPVIVTLSDTEIAVLEENLAYFRSAGYEVEPFGGKELAIRAIPMDFPSLNQAQVLQEMLTELCQEGKQRDAVSILEKTASMACKASIKGGQSLSCQEAELLVRELLQCENPYSCPHGRPTMIEFTKTDLEKKFKRIV